MKLLPFFWNPIETIIISPKKLPSYPIPTQKDTPAAGIFP